MKLTEEIVLYCREHYVPGDKELGITALAKRFNVSKDAIKDMIHGKSYKNVGGTIHKTMGHTPADIKAAVLAEYEPRSADANVATLAKKFNLSATTVLKIIHDGGRPKGKRAVVTDELRQKIYAEYIPHSREFGRTGLSEKYGLSTSTIGNILQSFPKKEKVADEVKEPAQRTRKRAEVLDEIKEAIIIAHDEEKLSVRALAERFSLAREVVKEVLTEAGVEIRQRQIVDEETKQKVIKMYATGNYSVRELAEKFSINRATLTQWVKGMAPPKQAKPTEVDDATREQILRFYSHGHGVSPIAKTLNLPQSLVRKIVNGEA